MAAAYGYKEKVTHFFQKSQRYIILHGMQKQCLFSKAKMVSNANMEILCLGRRSFRVCDVLKFGRNWP